MKRQFGRSMVEMLGVLAIIGVLSIGGILGYRRAVNNHQANTILDDANRLAFVVMENDRTFTNNDYITNSLEFTQNSPYNTEAFLGAGAGQFGIIVESVPRGVCESLVPKAAVEYKVRVLPSLPGEEIYQVLQMSNTGTVYDSFHKDICGDENDVVLYFGDTSAQCNKPEEGETYTKCLSNADCCGGDFCWFPNDSDYTAAGIGQCRKVSDFTPTPATAATVTAAGKTWIRSNAMNWWSAQNWCAAQGKRPVSRADLGCGDNLSGTYCTQEGTVLKAIQDTSWKTYGGCHWLEDYGNSSTAYDVNFSSSYVNDHYLFRNFNYYGRLYALCQ